MVFKIGDQWTSGMVLLVSSCFGEGGESLPTEISVENGSRSI